MIYPDHEKSRVSSGSQRIPFNHLTSAAQNFYNPGTVGDFFLQLKIFENRAKKVHAKNGPPLYIIYYISKIYPNGIQILGIFGTKKSYFTIKHRVI